MPKGDAARWSLSVEGIATNLVSGSHRASLVTVDMENFEGSSGDATEHDSDTLVDRSAGRHDGSVSKVLSWHDRLSGIFV